MATCPTSPVFSKDGSIATPTEPHKPCNDLSLFRNLMVRGLEVHDEREDLRTTKTVTILWLSPDHTTLHYGPSKDDVFLDLKNPGQIIEELCTRVKEIHR